MSFFKKLFHRADKEIEAKEQEVFLSLDDAFVHNFQKKGGKFLYSTEINEVQDNITKILEENSWKSVTCFDTDLKKLLKNKNVDLLEAHEENIPFFTTCEHLISDNGEILF